MKRAERERLINIYNYIFINAEEVDIPRVGDPVFDRMIPEKGIKINKSDFVFFEPFLYGDFEASIKYNNGETVFSQNGYMHSFEKVTCGDCVYIHFPSDYRLKVGLALGILIDDLTVDCLARRIKYNDFITPELLEKRKNEVVKHGDH